MTSAGKADFMRRFGAVWEHSPWIAEAAWEAGAPDGGWSVDSLHAAMCGIMRAGSPHVLERLVRAHPDLAGRLAIAQELTKESTAEQSSAGLTQLTPEEQRTFLDLNESYKAKFGFPFIVAVTGLSKLDVLAQFRKRLDNGRDAEWREALGQIEKIALIRIRQIFAAV
jgi:2-oxo-4-hydroxy-4-carboxy-5-ureidoimidazoline decarboxylase